MGGMGDWTQGWDDVTWLALGAVLTIAGLALSALAWSRRGPASGLRGVAWSLVPLAAALTGTLRLLGAITEDVARWATRLVFSPAVWVGIAVAGLSVLLFVVSGMLRRRASREPRPARGRAPASDTGPREVAARPSDAGAADDDLADIEEILRRRGIT